MSYVGVTINGVDTLSRWGLILLADLVVESPPLQESRVKVSGRSGSLNLSYGLTGEPEYDDRSISFSLFAYADSAGFDAICAEFKAAYHGRDVTIQLPTYQGHYFRGTLSAGASEGYAGCKIPISITAEPYAYKNEVTVVTAEAGPEVQTIVLTNEQRRVSPKVSTTAEVLLGWKGYSVALSACEDVIVNGLVLDAGENPIEISGSGTMIFKYQEARL